LMTIRYSLREGTNSRVMEAMQRIPNISFESNRTFVWVEERPKQPINPLLIASGTFTEAGQIEVNVNSTRRRERVGRTSRRPSGT
jgi:hypothetical protein